MGVRRINVCIDALLVSSAQWHSGCSGQLGTKPRASVARTGRVALALSPGTLQLTAPAAIIRVQFHSKSPVQCEYRRRSLSTLDAATEPDDYPAPAARRATTRVWLSQTAFHGASPPVHTPLPRPILIALSARTYHDPADTAPLRRSTPSSSSSSASRSRSPGRSTTPSASVPPSDNTSAAALATLHATLGHPSTHGTLPNSCCLHIPTERSPRPTAPRRDCTVSSMTT
ncbi:hypothetical protein Q7P35_008623 [Cladosporium inversicolor]